MRTSVEPPNRLGASATLPIADRLSKTGWSLGWVSAIDSEGRTIWIVDAHRDDGKRFVARSDEMLSAFLELERVARESLRFLNAE